MPFHAASKFLLVFFFASESTLDPRRLYSSVDITQLTFLAWGGWPIGPSWGDSVVYVVLPLVNFNISQIFTVKVYCISKYGRLYNLKRTRLKWGEQSIEDYPVSTIEWILENLSQSTYLLACLLLMLLSRVTEFPIHLIRLRLGVSEFPGVSAPSFFQRLLLLTLGRLEKRVSAKLLTSDSGNRIISQKQITNKFKNIYIYIYTKK